MIADMNKDKFFRLNAKESDLSKGIAMFDYTWLRNTETDGTKEYHVEYPVYLVFSQDSIDFKVNYYDDKYIHQTILSLPLSAKHFAANTDEKDTLTAALVERYKDNFPEYKQGSNNYLWQLHWKTFWKNKDWNDSDVSYSTLNIFDTKWTELIDEIQQWYENHKNEDNVEDNFIKNNCEIKKQQINRFIRKLILDFMFDLEHNGAFKNSPYYEFANEKLKENYFFSALAAKANFYYWREMIKKETECPCKHGACKKHLEVKLKETDLSVYTEYYLKAKIQWEKAIRNPKAEENFNGYKDKWFCDPEIEMRDVYRETKAEKKLIKQYFKTR
jgi:hypothetical protein